METVPERWRIEMLGGLRARRGQSVIERFQTQKTGALLAYLAFYPDRRHRREELIDLLWPDAEEDAGRHRLSQALTWLRSQLEPDGVPRNSVLLADRQSVGLDPQKIETDVAEFEKLLSTARRSTPPADTAALERAVALYQGDLLPGSYDDLVLAERGRLQDAFIGALRSLAQQFEHAHEFARAVTYARRALEADPLAEELHCDLIRLLAADGEPAAAARQFREMERLLARELGEAPSEAARAILEQIRRITPAPIAVAPRMAPALPAPLTRFFGREAEIAQAQDLLAVQGVRLLTLTGIGGGGKTRLAIEIAHRLAAHFPDALGFVPLADLADAQPLPAVIAEALRLPRSADLPLDHLVASLSGRTSLLVLDNLEHIVEDAAPLIGALLERVPGLFVLATSRRRLGLSGEREIAVPPLQVPAHDAAQASDPAEISERLMALDSVRLFVDRAQAVRPAFVVTPANADAVSRLCERLEGLPLAIELCAAWAQTLSPEQMLSHLSHRFDLLVSRRADLPARHRTLRAALEYSFDQLSPALRLFFVSLSVFRGGWTLDAAEAVCGESGTPFAALSATTELRERSLILADSGGDAEMRYRMLESLREFAADLPPAQSLPTRQRAHAAFFLALSETAEAHLSGPDQLAWLARLDTEHDNLRAALAWALDEGDSEIGLRMAGALAVFWEMRGYLGEGQDWLERLLALPAPSDRVRAKALNARGYLARNQGDAADVNAAMTEALTLWRSLGDRRGTAQALLTMATLAYSREDCPKARTLLEEGLDLARGLADQPLIALSLLNLGNIALEQAEWDQARAHYTESLALCRALGVRSRAAHALNNLGLVARYQGDLAAAFRLLQDALALCREVADRSGIAECLLNLGTVHRLEGRLDDARSFLHEAAALAAEVGETRILAWCLKETGHVACAQGDWAGGVRLLTAAKARRAALGISFKPVGPAEIARDLARAEQALGESAFAAARAAGAALDIPAAFAEATKSP